MAEQTWRDALNHALSEEMERDAWYSSMRDASDLAQPEVIGRYAAERALANRSSLSHTNSEERR